MKKIYAFALTLFLGLTMQAQQSAIVKKADKHFDRLEYLKAIEYYLKAVESGKADDYVYRRLADSYYQIFDAKNAVKYYEKIINKTQDPEVYYRYAQMLKALGRYKESEPWMQKFAEMKPSDHRAIAYRQNPGYLVRILDQRRKKFIVTEEPTVNSEYADYGAQLKNTKLYFVSHRVLNKKHYWDGQPYGEIFEADYENGLATNIHQVRGQVNTKYHEGAFSFSPDGKTMYFTRNNFSGKLKEDSTGISRLKIYSAKWNGLFWSDVEELPFNSDYFDTGHPAVTPDGKRMYFASNRPGTYGQSDIFYVDIYEDGTFGEPVHLGPEINTEGREDYPFFAEDNTLYFSSDGHPGLGGRDIFASKYVDGKFSRARNLGVPVNSGKDDITFVFYPKDKKGFMASNRNTTKPGDYDIFTVQAIKPVFDVLVEARVIDAKTKRPIPNATVVLTDNAGNPMATKTTDEEGKVDFLIEANKDVVLEARAEGYENNKVTVPGTYDEAVEVEIPLNPIEEIILAEKLKLNPIYFDFDKWNIRRDAAFELDKVVEVMKKYPNLKIHVESHADCRGTRAYNKRLSEKRAKATVQYIISKGIDPSRLTWEGKGEDEPKVVCKPCHSCTEEQHQLNRRSDFIIVAGHPFKNQEEENQSQE
ncbi:MAG: OmpA family protein [Chlorobi bacterium]|nr:OmpA family protein [Chlorobiota bacterium]